jgi:hypothetical protein
MGRPKVRFPLEKNIELKEKTLSRDTFLCRKKPFS